MTPESNGICENGLGSVDFYINESFSVEDLWFAISDGVSGGEIVSGPSITNIEAGAYEVTITDGFCTQYYSFIIETSDDIEIIDQTPSNYNEYEIECHGSLNASMNLAFQGGTPPYNLVLNYNGTETIIDQDIYSPILIDLIKSYKSPEVILLLSKCFSASDNIEETSKFKNILEKKYYAAEMSF